MGLFTVALLFPLAGLGAAVGPWKLDGDMPGSTAAAVRTSVGLTALAMGIVVVAGTPAAWYLARRARWDRWIWEGALLLSVLLPPLALGILLSLAYGSGTSVGRLLLWLGVPTANSPAAFVMTQVYVAMGYFVLAARSAFAMVPHELEQTAALLGLPPRRVFWQITFPLAQLGLGVALSLAWVRALGEFGAVMVTSYFPAGMPVQLWVDLQDAGLAAVMPLLLVFLLCSLPLPWLIHLVALRRDASSRERGA
ncbi:MAG: ABC transporter permease subunit [Cyanobacteria bacterium REEB65]|nr:ABC transporter permease subunit [Cyanobacteria bacterium REEB65]